MSRWRIAQRSLIEPEVAFSLAFISTKITSQSLAEWRLTTPRIKLPQAPLWRRGCLFYGDRFPSRRILKAKGSLDSFRKHWWPGHEPLIGAHNPDNFL